MKNKFINLLLEERTVAVKLGVFILLVFLCLSLNSTVSAKKKEAMKLKDDKAVAISLENQLQELNKKLKLFEEMGKVAGSLQVKANLSLKGIIIKDGKAAALINNDIYQQNDLIAGCIITSITTNTITLEDPATGEESKIQLPE
ncbi:MAG: hypothetical protein FJZ12_02005 [Candidatus Omnitrophica bacterium]|nr:hypothetical protein [Candidatus Omnitrophota bacterium]